MSIQSKHRRYSSAERATTKTTTRASNPDRERDEREDRKERKRSTKGAKLAIACKLNSRFLLHYQIASSPSISSSLSH